MRRPLHTQSHGERRRCAPAHRQQREFGQPPVIVLVATAMLIVLVILAFWLLTWRADWRPVIDFIAPTAKLARETGWVGIAEGL